MTSKSEVLSGLVAPIVAGPVFYVETVVMGVTYEPMPIDQQFIAYTIGLLPLSYGLAIFIGFPFYYVLKRTKFSVNYPITLFGFCMGVIFTRYVLGLDNYKLLLMSGIAGISVPLAFILLNSYSKLMISLFNKAN